MNPLATLRINVDPREDKDNDHILDIGVVPLAAKVSVAGRVIFKSGTDPKIDFTKLRFVFAGSFLGTHIVDPAADGTFEIKGVNPGLFEIAPPPAQWDLPAGFYVASVTSGGDVLKDGLVIETDKRNPVEIVIADNASTVEGVVRGRNDSVVPDARVILIPPPTRRGIMANFPVALSNESGEFVIDRVPPGDYRLLALDLAGIPDTGAFGVVTPTWQGADFLHGLKAVENGLPSYRAHGWSHSPPRSRCINDCVRADPGCSENAHAKCCQAATHGPVPCRSLLVMGLLLQVTFRPLLEDSLSKQVKVVVPFCGVVSIPRPHATRGWHTLFLEITVDPGQEQNTSELYKLPFHSIFTGTITTPIIGMAMGAYDEHVEMQQKRTRAAYLGEKASLDPFAAVRIARASSEIDAAWALLVNNIREEQAYVAKGEKIPLKTRLKVRRDQVLGSQRAIDAIDSLFEASGGRALATGTYLQRAWRDAHAGRVHAANDPERALQMYGAHEFGHKVDPGMY